MNAAIKKLALATVELSISFLGSPSLHFIEFLALSLSPVFFLLLYFIFVRSSRREKGKSRRRARMRDGNGKDE